LILLILLMARPSQLPSIRRPVACFVAAHQAMPACGIPLAAQAR
jgi:hypothetical protein